MVRHTKGQWWIAVIEPRREDDDKKAHSKSKKAVLALPKGLVDPGEIPEQTAVREVREETGVEATLVAKLTDIRYVYVRTWSDKQCVFKIVSFYLLLYRSGRIGNIPENMRHEVKRAFWLQLDDAAQQLTYRGEREPVKLAQAYLHSHPEELNDAARNPR